MFNTDQGVQFTTLACTGRLARAGSEVSVDGRGRPLDNIVDERLWRSVTHEDMYLKDYTTVPALDEGHARNFQFYNHEQPHQRLAYRTPAEVHVKQQEYPASRPPYF
jgi:putative transposase